MRNTLPLSSFPLQALLGLEQWYQWGLSVLLFLLVLFKTYNLPYSGAMSVQEGVILLAYICFMQGRIRYGIGANRVSLATRRPKAQPKWRYS